MMDILLVLIALISFLALFFFSWVVWGTFRYRAPLISTSSMVAQKMIKIAEMRSGDVVYDLGCGTGAILFEVVKNSPKQLKCRGYDLVRPAIWFAQIKNVLLKKNIHFQSKDFFTADLSDADVIFCYLLPVVMKRIYEEKWGTLKPGCKIVSHGFPITSLQPTRIEPVGKGKIYVYQKQEGV